MNRRGFTLIELVVAMVVVIFILGLSIARFAEVTRAEELRVAAGTVKECIEDGQQASQKNVKPYVWVQVTATNCVAGSFSSATHIPPASVGTSVTEMTLTNIYICSIDIDGTLITNPIEAAYLLFSGYDQGRVRIISTKKNSEAAKTFPAQQNLDVPSSGLGVKITMARVEEDCFANMKDEQKVIVIPKIGTPIYVQ